VGGWAGGRVRENVCVTERVSKVCVTERVSK